MGTHPLVCSLLAIDYHRDGEDQSGQSRIHPGELQAGEDDEGAEGAGHVEVCPVQERSTRYERTLV